MVITDDVLVAFVFSGIAILIGLGIWFGFKIIELSVFTITLGVVLGVIGVLIGTNVDVKIRYYEQALERNNKAIGKAKMYCKRFNYSSETCNNTFLYKLNEKQAYLNNQLSEMIMEKYRE